MRIEVKIEKVYGADKVYPVCDKAKLFASISGTKTLPLHVLETARQLGFEVVVVPAIPKSVMDILKR
jgi:hypothetical protein